MSDTGLPRRPTPGGAKPKRSVLIVGGVAAAGIVYWAYKRNKASAATTTTDPNIDPATGQPYTSDYGTTGMGGATGTTPSLYGYTDQFGNLITNPGVTTVTHPTTNGAWVQQAAGYLIANGYDPLTVLTALGKYIAGSALTDDQMSIVQAAIATEGRPPESVVPAHTAPPAGQTNTGGNGSVTKGVKYVTQFHQITAATGARSLVQRFSIPGATPNQIEVALRASVADPRNARYMAYYVGHGGSWPAKAALYVHTVQSG